MLPDIKRGYLTNWDVYSRTFPNHLVATNVCIPGKREACQGIRVLSNAKDLIFLRWQLAGGHELMWRFSNKIVLSEHTGKVSGRYFLDHAGRMSHVQWRLDYGNRRVYDFRSSSKDVHVAVMQPMTRRGRWLVVASVPGYSER